MASSSSPPDRDTAHTFGPSCRLNPVTPPEPVGDGLQGIPPIKAQFFYSSPIPIDDPLSAATIVGSSETRASKLPLRPFSPGDNTALERAWLKFSSDRHRRNHRQAQRNRSPSPSLSKENAQKLAAIVAQLAAKHKEKHDREGQAPAIAINSSAPCCSELLIDASAELRREFCSLTRRRQQSLDHDRVVEGVMELLSRIRSSSAEASSLGSSPPKPVVVQLSASSPSGGPAEGSSGKMVTAFAASADGQMITTTTSAVIPARPPVPDGALSGKPFVRLETNPKGAGRSSSESRPGSSAAEKGSRRLTGTQTPVEAVDIGNDLVEIPVGISRLHMVSLPILQMKPIYWSPVNDISVVLRATWFYKETMIPVEPAVANQLEYGYRELRPWTETWADELRSALDVGPLGEEKVSHRLWPDPADKRFKSEDGGPLELLISSEPFCSAHCFSGEAASEGTLEPARSTSEEEPLDGQPESRTYSSYHVIYKDESAAFLLKPSLAPSAYYGRKPVARIMRGQTVGIPVVRGFDWGTWERVHAKKPAAQRKPDLSSAQAPSHDLGDHIGGCPGCRVESERGQVTDLVLIAHGIGQKFAERVESFHFTHAVNAFRRAVNMELESPAVKSILRPNQNGIMVLPVNWRHLIRFEDGGPGQEDEDKAPEFTLKDIEPGTIPAVRSMISDVMFDIPFYMSHHKPKMISALVGEANRVYRLWCRNNPGFSSKGRVHLIGHSLGSAMAIEILSKQPTRVPRLDLSCQIPEVRHFEFDTTNLFLLGSPAGFFLLLERGGLVPRRGHMKPGADPADIMAKDIVSDIGTFGCLPVDNIYNVLAKEDPIAYLLTGSIDPIYAASLKTAYVPSTATSFFKSVGDAMRGIAGFPSTTTTNQPSTTTAPPKKTPTLARLPSQLELEIHDFSREEIAEKKAFLLNDNGQLDYYLRSGGGPLEIQYLNMLSAHTSYWTNQDLIRMICVEVGRMPGRANTLAAMRAVKVVKTGVRGTMLGGPMR